MQTLNLIGMQPDITGLDAAPPPIYLPSNVSHYHPTTDK
jgi:hypothetical protein